MAGGSAGLGATGGDGGFCAGASATGGVAAGLAATAGSPTVSSGGAEGVGPGRVALTECSNSLN